MKAPMEDEKSLKDLTAKTISEVETLAIRLRELIASQPTKELLAYAYSSLLLGGREDNDLKNKKGAPAKDKPKLARLNIDEAQFLLEYVHAVLATTALENETPLDEAVCAEIADVATRLKSKSMLLAMMLAKQNPEAQFGPETKNLMFRALSNWILLRGHRHQVLEEEFFNIVLAPHDAALKRVYGASASEIAKGIQALADSIRLGHMRAFEALHASMEDSKGFSKAQGTSWKDGADAWKKERPEQVRAAQDALEDLFYGGICCVSRHSSLPTLLLDDLSYAPAEETEFFAPGPYSGTPLRTLPARKKPFIKLGGEHYLTDPSFARDSAYRAILFNLIQREPAYSDEFRARQKEMSEVAFPSIFAKQLTGASVFHEVWYRESGNWFENDTLVLLDDVLILVEAKAGAAATIASPAADFDRHAQSVKDLIVKAYEQCRRFLTYLSSAPEVPLYKRENSQYIEGIRIRLSDYRVILPMGLTVESFSPFSAASKQLPGLGPILGKYPFVSVAIDEILVLTRFLPMTGQLMHYFEVRQQAAGIKDSHLFDEMDHLGAYISNNLFTDDLREQLADGANMVIMDGMSAVVDDYFGQPDWNEHPAPSQRFPAELQSLLNALDQARGSHWLAIDSTLRNCGDEGRARSAELLGRLRDSLRIYTQRYALMLAERPLFLWLYREAAEPDNIAVSRKAMAALVAADMATAIVVLIAVNKKGLIARVAHFPIAAPEVVDDDLRVEVEAMKGRIAKPVPSHRAQVRAEPRQRLGRNELCWCGSGIKYKRCHGR
jgi:hypothetical protein